MVNEMLTQCALSGSDVFYFGYLFSLNKKVFFSFLLIVTQCKPTFCLKSETLRIPPEGRLPDQHHKRSNRKFVRINRMSMDLGDRSWTENQPDPLGFFIGVGFDGGRFCPAVGGWRGRRGGVCDAPATRRSRLLSIRVGQRWRNNT